MDTWNANSLPSYQQRPLRNQQILLCEDSVEQSRLYLKFLQLGGADVTLECNGEAAVETVRKSPGQFAAVVMDFQMPEMDGLCATRHLREMGYTGAIIAVTAFGSRELEQSWREAGCDAYVLKPMTRQVLISTVQRRLPLSQELLT